MFFDRTRKTFGDRKIKPMPAHDLVAFNDTHLVLSQPVSEKDIGLVAAFHRNDEIRPSLNILNNKTPRGERKLQSLPNFSAAYFLKGEYQAAQSMSGQVIDANNALKRGNTKQAQTILGRQITPEELSRRQILPSKYKEVRGQMVPDWIPFTSNAVGQYAYPNYVTRTFAQDNALSTIKDEVERTLIKEEPEWLRNFVAGSDRNESVEEEKKDEPIEQKEDPNEGVAGNGTISGGGIIGKDQFNLRKIHHMLIQSALHPDSHVAQ